MRKFISFATVIAAICLLGFWAGKNVVLAHFAASSSPRPFLREARTVVVSHGSTTILHSFDAVRSDGSRADGNMEIAPDGGWRLSGRRLALVTERRDVVAADHLGMKSTMELPPDAVRTLLAPWSQSAPPCSMSASYHYAGNGSYLGHHVMKFEKNTTQAHWRVWLASDLGCQELWAKLELLNADGSLDFTSERQTVSIQEGEPPSSLFDISDDYSEVLPSQLILHGLTQPLNGEAPNSNVPMSSGTDKQKLSHLDNYYSSHRPS
ncbi:MAG TPA: hypothetical protein VN661_05715 [Candidatus Acidoferrales bacterium]|nr:hypothetical protein [Candidatus Acidoferrales bacterium]